MAIAKHLLSILAIAVTISRIAASPLVPRQQTAYDFRGCDAGQQTSIDNVLDDMQELAKAAIAPSEATNAGQDWYKAWWGTYDSNKKGMLVDEKINTRYEKLAAFKNRKAKGTTFACDTTATCCNAGVFTYGLLIIHFQLPSSTVGYARQESKADRNSGGVVACQNRRGDQDIFLCSPFWRWNPERAGSLAKQSRPISLELDKWRSRPSILLHELTHALFKSRWRQSIIARLLFFSMKHC